MTRRLAIEDLRPTGALPAEEPSSEEPSVSGSDAGVTEPPPANDPADALIGRVVAGRYRVSKVLGRGGMGVVFEGEHLELKKRVAIKVLVASYARDAEALARFEREARTAATLGHANIVGTLDLGRLDTGEPFLVMEFVAGQDLVELIRAAGRGELPTTRMLGVLEQIAAALDAIHETGVVHRDIKAENILLVPGPGGRDVVKVVDFGLATLADAERRGARLTREGMVIGTPEYIAPECVRGALGGPAADRYALAVLAFELCCGWPPFEDPAPMEILVAKMTKDAPPLSSMCKRYGPALDGVLAQALARDPAARHASCKELVDAMRVALAEDAKRAPRALDDGADAAIPMRAPPYRAVIAVVALLALLGVGALGWNMRSGPPEVVSPPVTTPVTPLPPTPVAPLPPPPVPTPDPTPAPAVGTDPPAVTQVRSPSPPGQRHPGGVAPSTAPVPPPPVPTAPPVARVTPAPSPPRHPPAAAPSTAPVVEDGPAAGDLVRSAQASLLRGQVAQARDLFRDATRIAPRHAAAWRGLGIASEQLHEAPEARRAFQRYLELAPDAADAAAVRGRLERLGG